MRRCAIVALSTLLLLAAGGCGHEKTSATPLPPATLTDDATGYYCGMALVEHDGPKAQIFIQGSETPLWFSQVRDAVHFVHSKEEPHIVTAFYVTDESSRAQTDNAEGLRWIPAADAYFVIESRTAGSMGAPETVPFPSAESAARFSELQGGEIVRLTDIPDDYILAPYSPDAAALEDDAHDAGH